MMASHIGQGIAFIGVSIFAGWFAFQAVSSGDAQTGGDPVDEIAAQADAIAANVETDYAATAYGGASTEYQSCLDQSGGVTANMLDCIGAELKRTDGMLNASYRKLMEQLSPAEQSKLRSSQRNWISSRDETCKRQAAADAGGTHSSVVYNSCLVQQTSERVEWLHRYASRATAQGNAIASDWSNTIDTSFGEYVGPGAVCEGEYWQLTSEGGKQTLSWMDDNGTPALASDDFYVEYDFSFDGSTLSLRNGKITTYRTDNPRDGTRVSDKQFPMRKTSDGILLNGELLQVCRN